MEKEQRIRAITSMYYSRPEIQEAIFSFSQNREVVPRYFEGFGKRPDALQYKRDIFELAKKGATSFHCSEELWENPLGISTNMNEKQFNESRTGWDLLIDIDSKYIDYSKILAKLIIKILKFHGVKNLGIKFSGSKGFHIIIPWNSFPKEINKVRTSDMFPEWPRIISKYIAEKTKEELTKKINELSYENLDYGSVKKYIRREGGSEEIIGGIGENKSRAGNFIVEASDKKTFSQKFENIKGKEESWNKDVIPDIILVSPRHLFRMPYSLHEKTSLASVPLNEEEIEKFELKDADPMKIKIKNFMPDSKDGEATELLIQALDWHKENFKEESEKKIFDFKPVKIDRLSDEMFPSSIKKILQGMEDGKKRALFILINLFRSIGLEKDELEKRIYEWNKKNKPQMKEGYIKSQLSWSYRNKIVPPPNFSKDYYKGIGIIPTEEELRYKNPVNYIIKKNKDNFKN